MFCPFCRHPDSRVIDSRTSDDGLSIRRRRQCPECGRRFSTTETASLSVIKRNGVVELFSREKIVSGVRKACQGRPVTDTDLAVLAQRVEETIRATGAAQVGGLPYLAGGARRALEDALQRTARGVLVAGGGEGALYLAADLVLADDDRLKAGADREEVADGRSSAGVLVTSPSPYGTPAEARGAQAEAGSWRFGQEPTARSCADCNGSQGA